MAAVSNNTESLPTKTTLTWAVAVTNGTVTENTTREAAAVEDECSRDYSDEGGAHFAIPTPTIEPIQEIS